MSTNPNPVRKTKYRAKPTKGFALVILGNIMPYSIRATREEVVKPYCGLSSDYIVPVQITPISPKVRP